MREIDFVEALFASISKQESLCSRLEFFRDCKNWRWENWLQMEVAFKLLQEGIPDSYVESSHCYDKRNKLVSGALRAHIDLIYRHAGKAHDYYNAIEIKVIDNPLNCIKGSLKDLIRISQTKSTEFPFRGVFSVSVIDLVETTADETVIFINEIIKTTGGKLIDFGPYKAVIIGWQAKNLGAEKKEYYRQWIKEIKEFSESFGVIIS